MGLFGGNAERRAARLERQIARKESKLSEVRKVLKDPPPPQMQSGEKSIAVKDAQGRSAAIDMRGVATDAELAELRSYVDKMNVNQDTKINALDEDMGRLAEKSKIRASGMRGGGLGGGGMGAILMIALLGGGTSSTTTTGGIDTTTLLLIAMLAGGDDDDDGGMGSILPLVLVLGIL